MMTRNRGSQREALAEPKVSRSVRLFAQLGIRLPGELAVRLKTYCQQSGESLNKTVAVALEQYLAVKVPEALKEKK